MFWLSAVAWTRLEGRLSENHSNCRSWPIVYRSGASKLSFKFHPWIPTAVLRHSLPTGAPDQKPTYVHTPQISHRSIAHVAHIVVVILTARILSD